MYNNYYYFFRLATTRNLPLIKTGKRAMLLYGGGAKFYTMILREKKNCKVIRNFCQKIETAKYNRCISLKTHFLIFWSKMWKGNKKNKNREIIQNLSAENWNIKHIEKGKR